MGKRILDRARVDVFLGEMSHSLARRVAREDKRVSQRMEQQAVRIGDAVFVTSPCEVFAENSLEVKNRSPFEKTFVIGLTSGHGGYLPTKEEFLEGRYEALMNWSPKSVDVYINSSLELIGRVTK